MDKIIKHRFSIIILFLAASMVGFLFLPSLNLQLNPRQPTKRISVLTQLLNASPSVIELKVTTPLEAGFAQIEGISEIKSISSSTTSNITLTIDDTYDLDMLRFAVANKVRALYPGLPDEASYPEIKMSGGDDNNQRKSPLITYSLYASDYQDRVSRYARDNLVPGLSTIEGLDRVELSGYQDREWTIRYDPLKMEAFGITLAMLKAKVAQYDQQETIGKVQYRNQEKELLFNTTGATKLSDIVLQNQKKQTVALRDIAEVVALPALVTNAYRIDGKSNVRLSFYATQNANQLVLADRIKKEVDKIRGDLPGDYDFLLEYDDTEFLKEELGKIRFRSLLSLALLLLLVLLIYRNLRDTAIILIALFANLGLAITAYSLLHVSINLYALAAITISFGIIIDNALVVIHHLKKYGNLSVFPALVSSTLTTIASLVIIFFLPDLWKNNLYEFSRVIMVNLSISLLVSGILVPALVQRSSGYQEVKAETDRPFFTRYFGLVYRFRKWLIVGSILLFGLPVYLIPTKWGDHAWYNQTLGSDTYLEDIKPWVDRMLGGTSRLFYRYVYESGQFRNNEETILYANVRLPEGSTFAQLDDLCRSVESYLSDFLPNQVEHFILQIYNGESASFKITFADENDYSFPYVLKNRLTGFATNLGGARWSIYGVGRGFSTGGGSSPPQYRLQMQGYNLQELASYAEAFAKMLEVHPRIKEVETNAALDYFSRDRYAYAFDYDRRLLTEQGFTAGDLRNALEQLNPTRQQVGFTVDNVPITLISQLQGEKSIWNIYNEDIQKDSSQLNLSRIAQIEKNKVPNNLHKLNQQYLRMLKWEYTGSSRFGTRYLEEKLKEFIPSLPLGYTVERSQYQFRFGEQKKQYGLLLIVFALIFMISAIHFESFSRAFWVLLFIPISFVGIFLTFYAFDFPFDQGGYTSFILLSGITVNSAILILTDYDHILKKGRAPIPAFAQAYLGKITPILLTIVSTIVGLIPFLWYGSSEPFWYSLAVGTIGGLAFSLIALTLIMPALVLRNKG